MCIGVISEYTREKQKKFCLRKNKKEIISDNNNPFDFVAIQLPYSIDEIEKMHEKRRIRLMKRAVFSLKNSGVCNVVLTENLKKYRNKILSVCDDVIIPDGKEKFYRFIPDAVRKATKKCSINLLEAKVCISTGWADRITEYLLRELCYDIKNFIICTSDTENANMLCMNFFEENGFFPQITNTPMRADVFIDLENNRVRIGRNLMIDGVGFDFNLNGYEVDMLDVALCLTDFDICKRVISYNCGKNKLTL